LSVKHWQTMKGEKHNSSCTEECQASSRLVPGDTRRYQACHNCVVLWWYYVPGVCVPSSGRSSSTSPPGDRTNRTVTAGRGRRIIQYSVPRSASNSTRMILGVLGVICFVLRKICRQCVSQVSQHSAVSRLTHARCQTKTDLTDFLWSISAPEVCKPLIGTRGSSLVYY